MATQEIGKSAAHKICHLAPPIKVADQIPMKAA